MKIYNVLIGIAIIITILMFSLPQLTGTIFVNNQKDNIPTDWLSALLLKHEKKSKLYTYKIPATTKAIKIIGNNKYNTFSLAHIAINENKETQIVTLYEDNDIRFSTIADTLVIKNTGQYTPSLTLDIDSNTQTIIMDDFAYGIIHPSKTVTFDLTIENNSAVILLSNDNQNIKNIDIKGQSTLDLRNCCVMPTINLQVNNSMVYVDPQNNIDSLKVNLIGKSNIKNGSINQQNMSYSSNDFEHIKTELGIKNAQINIYPTGNLKYYNLK